MAIKIIALTVEERQINDYTHKVIINFGDIPAGTTAQTVVILPGPTAGNATPGNLAVGMAITKVAMLINVAFASGTLTGLTASVGDGGSATQYTSAVQLQTGQTPVVYTLGAASGSKVYTSADQIKVTFTPATANINTLTTGELDVFLRLENMNEYSITI